MRLYNTATSKKENVEKSSPFLMYTCGPTVYDFAHIGNFRTFVTEDLLRRTLKYFGYEIKQVMNLTDVDDKTIKGAIAKEVSLAEFTQPYIDAFFEDIATLNIEKVELYPKATDFIDFMIEIIQDLLDKKVAYQTEDGSIYFAIRQFQGYGKLSHLQLDELLSSSEMADDEYDKHSASDFALWKGYDEKRDGQIFWNSPFGKGRPGWHLECSAMAIQLLGETVDLHAGGVDTIFPHHENEIAQSEAFTEKAFVKHWFHIEHLQVEGKKMSKSLGNFYTLRDLLAKGYTGRQVRYLLLSGHYRMQLNFTMESLQAAKASLERIDSFVTRLKKVEQQQGDDHTAVITSAEQGFEEALLDDLNAPKALSHLFDLIKSGNLAIDQGVMGTQTAQNILEIFQRWDQILGVLMPKKEEVPQEVVEYAQQRLEARGSKDYTTADILRQKIEEAGYKVKDTPSGYEISPL